MHWNGLVYKVCQFKPLLMKRLIMLEIECENYHDPLSYEIYKRHLHKFKICNTKSHEDFKMVLYFADKL